MNISIVIPLLNEEESLQELHHWIATVMQSNGFLYELIFIDDGSTDHSWRVIRELSGKHPEIKALRFLKNASRFASSGQPSGDGAVKGIWAKLSNRLPGSPTRTLSDGHG